MARKNCPLEEMELNVDELETLSGIFHAFSQRTRLAILLGLYHEYSPPEIADTLDVSRPGLQSHLEQMREQRLIRRNQSGQYQLTPLGQYFAEFIEDQRDQLLDIVAYLEQTESEVEEELQTTVSQSSISEQEWERLVSAQLWEDATDPVSEQLGLSPPDAANPEDLELRPAEELIELPGDAEGKTSTQLVKDLRERAVLDDQVETKLYDAVDPDALDAIFEDAEGIEREGLVAFEYQDRVIVVTVSNDPDEELSLYALKEPDS